ncbi:hypothetical protein [Paenibacillus zanthoxyli]|uniref:hypothetical protein n=1 Tax=Paenibacillus zanthoxyli TaxID=369399 RepID=UPI00046EA9AB|nr:hypothetical protein [Paenibacillus zanthoxyli]
MVITKALYWREIRRQKQLYKIIAIQLLLSVFLLFWRTDHFTFFSYFLYMTFLFSLITQNDIYFYDLTPSIESLLASPLGIARILKDKSQFVVYKSVVLGAVLFPVYLIALFRSGTPLTELTWSKVGLILLFLAFQYVLSIFIGVCIWIYGKRARIPLIVGQGLILNSIYTFSSWKDGYFAIVFIVCVVALYLASLAVIGRLESEKIISRCM